MRDRGDGRQSADLCQRRLSYFHTQSLSKCDEMRHPCLRMLIAAPRLPMELAVAGLQEIVINVLRVPEDDPKRQQMRDHDDFPERDEQREFPQVRLEFHGEPFRPPPQYVREPGGIEVDVPRLHIREERLNAVTVQRLGGEPTPEIHIEDECRRRLESLRKRHMQIAHETHQRRLTVVDLAITCLILRERRIEHRVEDFALLIAEQGFEGVDGRAEGAIKRANRLGKVHTREGFRTVRGKSAVCLHVHRRADAAADRVVAERECAERLNGGFPGDA